MSKKPQKKPVYKPNYATSRTIGGKNQREIAEDTEAFAKVETLQKQKAIKENAERQKAIDAENTGALALAKAIKLRNSDHQKIAEYRNKPHTELQTIYAEFIDLSQRRGLPLSNEDQDFGRLYLENLLSQPQRPQPADPKNILQRMKDAVTSDPKM